MMTVVMKALVSVLILAGSAFPAWANPARVTCDEGCGACGAYQSTYSQILSYDGTEWVPVCDYCFALFATEDRTAR